MLGSCTCVSPVLLVGRTIVGFTARMDLCQKKKEKKKKKTGENKFKISLEKRN